MAHSRPDAKNNNDVVDAPFDDAIMEDDDDDE
jgi:hypothetical protein